VRAYALYLMNRQLIPVERTAEILADLLGAPVSTGWLAGLAKEAADALENFSNDLAGRVSDADVVHVDETSARVSGAKWWFHVACTALYTFLGIHPRRGVAATDDFGILARVRGVLVHDRWAPYWRYDKATHAICNAHILRDLAGVAEVASQKPWADAMADLPRVQLVRSHDQDVSDRHLAESRDTYCERRFGSCLRLSSGAEHSATRQEAGTDQTHRSGSGGESSPRRLGL
jgi:hypothetical protein